MNRIKNIFIKKTNKVIPFIPAGYPNKNSTSELVLEAINAGAEIVEIGMPFSDPLADGPIIQKVNDIAIKNGITLSIILDHVKKIRINSQIPIILMGYINPIIKYGLIDFIKDCNRSGVDGLIIPDLPPEEAKEILNECNKNKVSLIFLIAPNASDNRIKYISSLSKDLIYCVSMLGTTGNKLENNKTLHDYLNNVKNIVKLPIIAGFGIKTRENVKYINSIADGAVVGSELINKMLNSNEAHAELRKYILELTGK